MYWAKIVKMCVRSITVELNGSGHTHVGEVAFRALRLGANTATRDVVSVYARSGTRSLEFNPGICCSCRLDCDSGTHKQKDPGKQNGSGGQAARKTVDHAFVTPRVKSAAKSRQAVSVLNEIVSKKDLLLKKAIENMERKERTLLTSKNNDFLKFVSIPLFHYPHNQHKKNRVTA